MSIAPYGKWDEDDDDSGFVTFKTTFQELYEGTMIEYHRLLRKLDDLERRNYALKQLWAKDMGCEDFEALLRRKGDQMVHLGRNTSPYVTNDILPNAGSQQYIKLSDL